MPLLIDCESRTGSLVRAINEVLLLKGVPGLSLREIGRQSGVSPSSMLHHYGSREHLLRVAAGQTGDARLQDLRRRTRRQGVLAFLPGCADDVLDARAWLAWKELWRSEDYLSLTVRDVVLDERAWMARIAGYSLADEELDHVTALVDGLLAGLCRPSRPLPLPRAQAILARDAGPVPVTGPGLHRSLPARCRAPVPAREGGSTQVGLRSSCLSMSQSRFLACPLADTRTRTGAPMTDPTEVFEQHRSQLVGAAYRILGSRSDAEDVVQEAWIRWSDVDLEVVDEPRAYLLTIATRLALNRVRQLTARKESYVGPWLPEPVATDGGGARSDGEAAAELADEVSMAMLIVLQSLSPLERAAFVLTEVFAMTGPEVASALDRSPAAVRQLVHRARSHVQARQPRETVDQRRHREVTSRFLQATATGDIDTLMELLAPEVVLVTDGGGIKQAALRPIHGADRVLRWFAGVMQKPAAAPLRTGELTFELRQVNGEPALVAVEHGEVDGVIFVTVEGDRITALHGIRNPEKLGAV